MTTLIKVPFAQSGDKTTPPVTDASGGVNMTQGYTSAYSKDPATDPSAKRIERELMNGLFNLICTAINEVQVSGVLPFLTAADNGGSAFAYSKGATVMYSGRLYISTIDNNVSTPTSDNTNTNWSLAINLQDLVVSQGTTTGSFRILGKILIQWGTTNPGSTGAFTVQYPITFVNQPLIILQTRQSGTVTQVQSNVIADNTRTLAGFSGRNLIITPEITGGGNTAAISTQGSGSNGGFYLAIGV